MDQRTRYAYMEGSISIVVNAALFILKYWAGIVSGSVALMADAWHTLSDSISSVLLIAGIRISVKKPDKKHPFGHGRWEQITAIFIGFILSIIAWDFLTQSIHKFRAHEAAQFGTLAFVATVVSVIVKEGLARYAFFVSKKTGNTAVRADGWHHRSDALSSVVVLAGIMMRNYFWWIDSVLGFFIALFLFYATFDIIRDAISKLLGEKPSEELILEVKDIIHETTGLEVFPHHFHIHNYGTHRELTFHIFVDPGMDVKSAHCLATGIENVLKQKLNLESTIHIEPQGIQHL